ncbi:MAG: hypothetical protein KC917_12815 [Candidatus Omnitrophica bacterium]|nr:hypothetical protein [Candidatus Omnitrophota bacterium]
MPRDLSIHDEARLIQVKDRAGVGLPFSRGLMATSILATGLGTEHAYRIAARIASVLQDRNSNEVDAEELTEIAGRMIRESAGDEHAKRYLAWRRAKRSGRPIVVCLGGSSGVGKSTIATRLALRLGVNRVVTTDAIREVLRTVIPPTVLPELHVSTYESVDGQDGSFGARFESYRRQARAVGAATSAVASRLVTEGRSALIEGVHLLPGELRADLAEKKPDAVVVEFLLILGDERLHLGHLTRRLHSEPGRQGARNLENLEMIRRIQDELRSMAEQAGVEEFDVASPEDLTQRIVDQVVHQIEDRAEAPSTS